MDAKLRKYRSENGDECVLSQTLEYSLLILLGFLFDSVVALLLISFWINCRVTTCLQSLEMSGNLTAVREMSGILLKIMEIQGNVREKILSGKSCLKLFIVSCIFVSIQVFSGRLFCVKY